MTDNNHHEAEDRRLATYFMRRCIELLELCQEENDVLRRLDLEQRIIAYWRAAKTWR